MLNYAAENFPGALEGFTGWGIDSHQSPVSSRQLAVISLEYEPSAEKKPK